MYFIKLSRVGESAAVKDGLRCDAADGHHGQPAVLDFAQFESRLFARVGGEVERVHSEVSCGKQRVRGTQRSCRGQAFVYTAARQRSAYDTASACWCWSHI